jgi:hypothetical protein
VREVCKGGVVDWSTASPKSIGHRAGETYVSNFTWMRANQGVALPIFARTARHKLGKRNAPIISQ